MAGCGQPSRQVEGAVPAVKVEVIRETPPAELLRCPVPPVGLPTQGEAVIPSDWRSGIIRLAKSHGDLLNQVSRLIAFHTGEGCE